MVMMMMITLPMRLGESRVWMTELRELAIMMVKRAEGMETIVTMPMRLGESRVWVTRLAKLMRAEGIAGVVVPGVVVVVVVVVADS